MRLCLSTFPFWGGVCVLCTAFSVCLPLGMVPTLDPGVPIREGLCWVTLLLPRCACECGSTCKLWLSREKTALPSALHRLGSPRAPWWKTPQGGWHIGGVTEWVW